MQDSPLSIIASIAGILTFVAAILAAAYVRFTYLRDADSEYFQVKQSLSWFKTESTWMRDLVTEREKLERVFSVDLNRDAAAVEEEKINPVYEKEHAMYNFVVGDLGRLEDRLLECVVEAEEAASGMSEETLDRQVASRASSKKAGWTVVPRNMRGRTEVAMSWLPVRAKALELVRQRDALGSRVLFAQMSLISSRRLLAESLCRRVRDQEVRSKRREDRQWERLDVLERMAYAQHEKLECLEDLVYRMMYRSRMQFDGEGSSRESPGNNRPISRSRSGSKSDHYSTERQLHSEELDANPRPFAHSSFKPST